MTKLLKHQLKENIRDILPWIIVPIILSIVLNFINLYLDSAFLDFIMAVSMLVMYSSFAISMIIVILNDYKKFYGDQAAFYDFLLVKSKYVTTSRVLNIMILAILAGLIFLIEFFGFLVISTGPEGIGIKELFDQIKSFLDQFPSKTLIMGIITLIFSLLATFTRILASISIGSSKTFKDMGKFGPVLVFIIITIIVSILGLTLGMKFFETFALKVSESSAQTQSGFYLDKVETVEDVTKLLGLGTILNIIVSSVQIFLTNLFHKNKLTVA